MPDPPGNSGIVWAKAAYPLRWSARSEPPYWPKHIRLMLPFRPGATQHELIVAALLQGGLAKVIRQRRYWRRMMRRGLLPRGADPWPRTELVFDEALSTHAWRAR